MINVLITGASGTIGNLLTKYLLSEGKYNLTVLDLKNEKTKSFFKKYKKRIKTIYGDTTDRVLIESLVKDNDIIIHLAGVSPMLSNINKEICNLVDYKSVETISRAINYYNPDSHLIYASTTSLYGNNNMSSVKTKVNTKLSAYNASKFKSEKLIKSKNKNYTIVRLPLVLSYIKDESFIYNVSNDNEINVITKEDTCLMFSRLLTNINKFNKKTLNVGGNKTFNIEHKKLEKEILKRYGLSIGFLFNKIFMEKNYYSPVCSDLNIYKKDLDYQHDTFNNYLNRLAYKNRHKKVRILLANLYIRMFFK